MQDACDTHALCGTGTTRIPDPKRKTRRKRDRLLMTFDGLSSCKHKSAHTRPHPSRNTGHPKLGDLLSPASVRRNGCSLSWIYKDIQWMDIHSSSGSLEIHRFCWLEPHHAPPSSAKDRSIRLADSPGPPTGSSWDQRPAPVHRLPE